MVKLVVKEINGKKTYYLHQTIRTKEGYKNFDKYLGDKLPADIENEHILFFQEAYSDQFKIIESLKEQNKREYKTIPGSAKEKSLSQFSIKFTYNTNRIEGSTLSLKETSDIIEEGITPERKPLRDVKETEEHYKLFLKIINEKQKVTYQNTLSWHYDLFKETKKDMAGKIRDYQVKISGSQFMPPSPAEVYPEMKEFFKWLEKNENKYNPVVIAALGHFKFVSIHPFGDGNGRISRLVMNALLNKYNYPLYIIDYKDRRSYYNALEKSNMKNNPTYFLSWFIKNYMKFIKKK